MIFSSLIFTFYFLPIVLLLYYLSKEQFRNYILLVASLCFYAYGEPFFVFVMLLSIVLSYIFARLIAWLNDTGKKTTSKIVLFLDIVISIGILFVYKYLDFSIGIVNQVAKSSITPTGIKLPIGISFFTFQALSYVIDVYRGRVKVQKNPFYVALYISFFPQLVAGPIVRYSTIEEQIISRSQSAEFFAEGVRRFMLGFCKKILIANNVGAVASEIFSLDYSATSLTTMWLGSICYSLQILYDFSGYSDMAIGLGKMFGFRFEENFNYPYMAKSITDFWRRWHISLSQWFRDYVYIPLGGSRVSVPRQVVNLLIVWLLTGLWHGANYTFIVWGLFYFVLLVIEKYVIMPDRRKSIVFSVAWRVITLLCVNFAWVIFNSESLHAGAAYCFSMVGFNGTSGIIDDVAIRNLREYGAYVFAGILFASPIAKIIREKLLVEKNAIIGKYVEAFAYGIVFLWATSYLVLGAHNPFIYFNF